MEAWVTGRRLGQQREQLPHFQEVPGPYMRTRPSAAVPSSINTRRTSMQEQQRYRILHRALLVDIVDVQRPMPVDLDIPRELRDLVDARLRRAPVEALPPPCEQPLHVREGRAVLPPRVLQLIRPTSEVELLVEELEVGVGHSDLERLFGHLH